MRTKLVGTTGRTPSRWLFLGLCAAWMLNGCSDILSPSPPVRGQTSRTETTGRTSRTESSRTRPARTASGQAAVVLSEVSGAPGQTVSFTATLRTGGATVAGTQNDIQFDPANTPLARGSGSAPRCAANPAIGKGATAFTFRPSKCSGRACNGVRALVLSVTDVRPIADGSVLYTCKVEIPASARPGTYPLTPSAVAMSTPDGQEVPRVTGVAGSVTVKAKR